MLRAMKPSPAQNQPPDNDLTSEEIGVAHNVVAEFRRKHPNFRGYDFDDLLQECYLHWIARRDRFRSGRGASRSTFMGKILRRKLLDILDAQMSDRRQMNQRVESLEPPSEDGEEGDTPSLATGNPDAPKNAIYLRLAIEEVLAELHPDQVRICEMKQEGKSVTEISRELNLPRPTIYDEFKRIREIFHNEGLRKFL